MTNHFSTVPIDGALQAAQHTGSDRIRPLALIVDDDPLITGTLAAILCGSGLAALTAHDGLSALDTAMLIPPEILISDLAVPGIDGFQLALKVKAATPDCEVILFAGHAVGFNLGAVMRSLKCDFTVLSKPVHPADLLDAVFALLALRNNQAEMHRTCRSPASYDFLSSRLKSDSRSNTNNVTRRLRLHSTA